MAKMPVVASSPQGRFNDGAQLINGAVLDTSEAYGKHLFCWWSTGSILHVHLGLIGKFRPAPLEDAPGDTIRLRLEGADAAWHLTGPQTCNIITPEERNEVVSTLGPDPLRRGANRKQDFVQKISATKRPIGAALLDQSIIAGIGNVYRAELLFLTGIHPETPANTVDPDLLGQLWDLTVSQLKRGLKWNRIVTVSDQDVDKRVTYKIDREDALYAYHRGEMPCRRCHTLIVDTEVAGRSIWYCPSCQPR